MSGVIDHSEQTKPGKGFFFFRTASRKEKLPFKRTCFIHFQGDGGGWIYPYTFGCVWVIAQFHLLGFNLRLLCSISHTLTIRIAKDTLKTKVFLA